MNSRQRRQHIRYLMQRLVFHRGPPQEDLMPLSELPQERWVGASIYAPRLVCGEPYWRDQDAPAHLRESAEPWRGQGQGAWWDARLPSIYAYDVGRVVALDPENSLRVYYKPVHAKKTWCGFNTAAQFLYVAQPK